MDLSSILKSIFSLIIIIWLANVLLKRLNKYTQQRARSIEILERFSVTKNSSLAIVKIIKSYYLMSFNENRNEILKELSVEEVAEMIEAMESQIASNSSKLFTDSPLTKFKEKYTNFFEKDKNETS